MQIDLDQPKHVGSPYIMLRISADLDKNMQNMQIHSLILIYAGCICSEWLILSGVTV